MTLLTWLDMAAGLADARDSVVPMDEQHYADRALAWMHVKGFSGVNNVVSGSDYRQHD